MKTQWSRQNIFKSIVTSILGVAMICFGGFLMFKVIDAQGWEYVATLMGEGLSLIGFGLYLLGIEDPRFPKRGAGGAAVAMMLVLLMGGCVSFKKCADKFGTGETHTIAVRDTISVIDTVYSKPDSVKGSLLLSNLLIGKVDSLNHVSSSLKLQLKLWYDKYTGLLHYRAEVKPDTVIRIKEVPVEIKADCPDTVILDPERGAPLWHRLLNGYKDFSAVALLLLIIILLVYLKMKR